ncbi:MULTISPECIES: hypothetical protein [unclassified Ensifer]|uniref:hypothetical protein n=1 Tax=unclassified Ensifer TaxID=2633371 RepID=UPI0007150235|nr:MULTISPECIES: hypothetical protein [unclassified Ensifer]KQX51243.1 hypothetical protein ASD49_32540 [Ensifer sp. Root1298]KQX80395.1 hypothetical protein ASD41_06800 [Ensifer sp. Root1312]KRC18900.1 hypothetical protein ASE29_07010 [Ensifer sp. Root74]KRD75380.1 hypothetical protein ASE71_17630 [Ensifer sp. Root954]
MKINHVAGLITVIGGLALAATAAIAQDSTRKQHVPLGKAIGTVAPTGPVPSLAVINSDGARIDGEKLVLTGVSANSIVFADRPVRAAGHVTTEQFIMQWDEGKDNFAIDPPNATVSVLGGNGSDISDVVVTLKSPKLEGSTLTFDIAVLEGSLGGASGPAAVFIDHFSGGFGGGGFRGADFGGGGFRGGDLGAGGFHGSTARVNDINVTHVGGNYWHAPVYNGAWYRGGAVAAGVVAGAAVGAAAANPYDYPPQCGYYPYPPCY